MTRVTLGLLLGALLPASLGAQEATDAQESIETDRPGFAFSAVTVPPRTLQVEIGLPQIEIADHEETETTMVRIAVVALRYGLVERLELRAASALLNRSEIEHESGETEEETGHGDLELGAKWHILTADGTRPDISLIGSVIVSLGEGPFTISDDEPGFVLNGVAGGAFGEGTSWTTVAGATWITPPGEDEGTISANLVAQLRQALSERWSGYVETEWFPSDGSSDPLLAGAGLMFLATPAVQLDMSFDHGLNDDAIDWIFGTGVSVRF